MKMSNVRLSVDALSGESTNKALLFLTDYEHEYNMQCNKGWE